MFRFARRGTIKYLESGELSALGFLTHAFCTRRGGVSRAPASLYEAAAMLAQAQQKAPAAPAFRTGGRVHHPKFGFGIVLGTEGSGDDLKVSVSFNRFGRKKLVAKIAKLESV